MTTTEQNTEHDCKVWSQYAPGVYEVALRGARIGSVQRMDRDEWQITECGWTATAIHVLRFTRRRDAVRVLCMEWERAHARVS